MTSTTKQVWEEAGYDEAEVRRRLGQVYSLLLEAARQKRAREAQAAAEQGLPARDTEAA